MNQTIVLAIEETARSIMLQWLKTRVSKWVKQYQQQQKDALLKENRSLKAQFLEQGGGKPIKLSPDQRERLAAKRKGLDSNWLKIIDPLDIEDESPNDPA